MHARDAERLLDEARRAWASGDAAGAALRLRRLEPAGLPGEVAARARLLAGEIALRAADPVDAVTSMFEAADLFVGVPRRPHDHRATGDHAAARPAGGECALDRQAGGECAPDRRAGGECSPDRYSGGARALCPQPGNGSGADRSALIAQADALVRAGEAICFLGDHFRYADVTRRAVHMGLLSHSDRHCGIASPATGPSTGGLPADGLSAGNPSAGGSSADGPLVGGLAADGADGCGAHGGGRRPGAGGGLWPAAGGPPERGADEAAALAAHIEGFGALFDGRYGAAVAALRRVVTMAERGGTGVDGLIRASAAALACGDDGAALRLARRAEAMASARGEISALPRALELKGAAELWRGAHDAAANTALVGVRAAAEAGQPNEADIHLASLALLAALHGDRAACRWRLAQVSTRHGRPRALGWWALGVLDLLAGRPQDAAARIGAIADPRAGRGHVLVQVMAAPDLVEAAVLAGDPGAARAALTVFDRWAASTGEPLRRALSARCHALLARRGSAEAEECFREALRLHLAGESEFERARTQLLFGRDLRRRRRPGLAREQVGAALDAFVRCGARPWAEQARAELRVCGGDGRTAGTAAPLTAQQLQVARLVAAGATNREVAARLFLSTRTVDHHMRNIFHRLGISSRVALAKMIT